MEKLNWFMSKLEIIGVILDNEQLNGNFGGRFLMKCVRKKFREKILVRLVIEDKNDQMRCDQPKQ